MEVIKNKGLLPDKKIVIIMSQPGGNTWEFTSYSSGLGFMEASKRYERMGLIGKCYVISSDGSFKTIN